MPLAFNLPPIDSQAEVTLETRPAKVGAWLDATVKRDPIVATRMIADELAETNRAAISDARRLELAELYWTAAGELWPQLEGLYARAAHPLEGPSLEAAKATLSLAIELSTAYKRLLASEADRRQLLGGPRRPVALVHRCLQCASRILTDSYRSYAPVPAKTWLDVHTVYAFALQRKLHQEPAVRDQPGSTPERLYLQLLLLALANPYGLSPVQSATLLRRLPELSQAAKLTDVAPVHKGAKAVAIVPLSHDFPPFSANKGGSIHGAMLYVLAFDLAFALQEQLRAIEAGGDLPPEVGKDPVSRAQYVTLLQRLLRQWASPPARHFNRLPARAEVTMAVGLRGVWHASGGARPDPENPPPLVKCEVVNQAPGGYALRQTGRQQAGLRMGDVIALRVAGRTGTQVALVRWFRNAMKQSGLEFGCELIAENPKAALGVPEDAPEGGLVPIVVLPKDPTDAGPDTTPPLLVVPPGRFHVDDAVQLKRSGQFGVVVLTKQVDQGPSFELYEFTDVG
jgi:hypothetical protein